jgi:hypothetical protein
MAGAVRRKSLHNIALGIDGQAFGICVPGGKRRKLLDFAALLRTGAQRTQHKEGHQEHTGVAK